MCGRFTQHYTWAELHALYNLSAGHTPNLQARYNIAPTTAVHIIRSSESGGRELVSASWWLIPGWWKKTAKDVPPTFNAKSETIADKPMFKAAYKSRRCIVPASGFYEWTGPKEARQPHLFAAADGSPILSFAGLWERWKDPATGEDRISCTTITTPPSAWMEPYHDRMPALLAANDHEPWLSGKLGAQALTAAPESALQVRLVSKRLNKTGVGDDDPTVLDQQE